MPDRLKQLVNILLDKTARIDEKDDAIICMGSLQDIRAIEPLVKIGADSSQDYLLKSSAGEAIARIMIELNIFDKNYLLTLSAESKNEAINLLLAKKPEWRKIIEEIKNEKEA